jgi:hypothetical protein
MIANETLGAAASSRWLEARGLDAKTVPHWYVEIVIASDVADTVIDVNIYPEEWGFVFRHGARVSSIRVTDIPFVHGRDDFSLLRDTPQLDRIGDLLATLERRFDVRFQRVRPTVKTNLSRAVAAASRWLVHQ